MLENLNKEIFDKNLNTNFNVHISEDETIALELIETREKNSRGMEAFTLILRGPSNVVLYDNTYDFEHDSMGDISMFISPYKRTDEYAYYDVQFSRLKDV